jgi:hypothetical protein
LRPWYAQQDLVSTKNKTKIYKNGNTRGKPMHKKVCERVQMLELPEKKLK